MFFPKLFLFFQPLRLRNDFKPIIDFACACFDVCCSHSFFAAYLFLVRSRVISKFVNFDGLYDSFNKKLSSKVKQFERNFFVLAQPISSSLLPICQLILIFDKRTTQRFANKYKFIFWFVHFYFPPTRNHSHFDRYRRYYQKKKKTATKRLRFVDLITSSHCSPRQTRHFSIQFFSIFVCFFLVLFYPETTSDRHFSLAWRIYALTVIQWRGKMRAYICALTMQIVNEQSNDLNVNRSDITNIRNV